MKKKILIVALSTVMTISSFTSALAAPVKIPTVNPTDGIIHIDEVQGADVEVDLCVGQKYVYTQVIETDSQNLLSRTDNGNVSVEILETKEEIDETENIPTGKYLSKVCFIANKVGITNVTFYDGAISTAKKLDKKFTITVKDHTKVTEPKVDATTSTTGYTSYEYCGNCGFVIKASEVIPKKESCTHKNSFKAKDNGTHINKEATCTEDGNEVRYCKDEGIYYDVKIPKKAHNYEEVAIKESTCTTTGLISYKCKDCGDTSKTEIIPAKKHSYVKEIIEAPGFDKEGIALYVCSECDKVKGGNVTINAYKAASINSVAKITKTSAVVYINPSKYAQKYVIRYSKFKNMKSAKKITFSGKSSMKLKGLTKGTKYYVQVQSVGVNVSEWSKVKAFTTKK